MSLNEVIVRKAEPRPKPYKMFDGGGLYLAVQPSGSKLWRLKYRYGGMESILSFGAHPVTSLASARRKRERARQLLATGRDPRLELSREASSQTFEAAAQLWHDNRRHTLDQAHSARIMARLDRDVLPVLGTRCIRSIEPPDVLAVLREIEARGALEICRRAKQNISQIFRFAVASGWADNDPTTCLDDALKPRLQPEHMHRIGFGGMPRLLAKIASYNDNCPDRQAVTRNALLFTLLTWARTKEIRFASADEFEELAGQQPLWRIPAARMKMRRDHLVPLSREAAGIVRAMLGERDDGYVFSDDGQTPISPNRMIGALYRLGYRGRQTVHGFRGLASTWANEALKATADPRNPARRYDHDWIEWQLAHIEANGVRRAYNAAQYLVPRRYMLQDWADQISRWMGEKGAGDSDGLLFDPARDVPS
jgi:integrase